MNNNTRLLRGATARYATSDKQTVGTSRLISAVLPLCGIVNKIVLIRVFSYSTLLLRVYNRTVLSRRNDTLRQSGYQIVADIISRRLFTEQKRKLVRVLVARIFDDETSKRGRECKRERKCVEAHCKMFHVDRNLMRYASRISDWQVALGWKMTTRTRESRDTKSESSLQIRRLGPLGNRKENISAALRISRSCKNCFLANYEVVLHRLRIKRSVICNEGISCVYHEKETCLQVHESTSTWWVHHDTICDTMLIMKKILCLQVYR